MTYRPNPRDPLTARVARSARETIVDPYAYAEGPAEPQYIVTDEPLSLGERALFWICAIGWPVMVVLIVARWV